MGKSHLIAFCAVLLMSMQPARKVTVLYPNEGLMEKDQAFMTKVRAMVNCPRKLLTICGKP